jgi:hypothetical protein
MLQWAQSFQGLTSLVSIPINANASRSEGYFAQADSVSNTAMC